MNRRQLMWKAGTGATAILLSGCSKQIGGSATKPRELRADTSHPIVDSGPKLKTKWDTYSLLITKREDMDQFEQNISQAISDWRPVEFPEQFVSVVSVVVPAKNTLEPEKIELQGKECYYELRVDENESADPDLSNPYIFNILHLWDLNGHSVPTIVSVHVNKGNSL